MHAAALRLRVFRGSVAERKRPHSAVFLAHVGRRIDGQHLTHSWREVELLREMLDDTKADRDSWKEQTQKITALIEYRSIRKKGIWARLTGG